MLPDNNTSEPAIDTDDVLLFMFIYVYLILHLSVYETNKIFI